MPREIRISPEAAEYVRRETKYRQASRPEAARQFTLALHRLKENLLRFPGTGRTAEDLPVTGVLRFVMGSYLVDYEPTKDQITILAIRHGRERPPGQKLDHDFDYES